MDDLLVQKNALYKGPPSGPVNQHEPMSRHDEILTKVIAKARVNITNFMIFVRSACRRLSVLLKLPFSNCAVFVKLLSLSRS